MMQMAEEGAVVSIVWFKSSCLRIEDHAALLTAHRESTVVLHVFVFDDRLLLSTSQFGMKRISAVRHRFLLESLYALEKDIQASGSALLIREGQVEQVIPEVARRIGAHRVYTNKDVCPEEQKLDNAVKSSLPSGCELVGLWCHLLLGPDALPFQLDELPAVFTPFRKTVENLEPPSPVPVPEIWRPQPSSTEAGGLACGLPGTGTLSAPSAPEAGAGAAAAACVFGGGAAAGRARLAAYLEGGGGRGAPGDEGPWGARYYKETRDGLLGMEYSTKLSPWLAHGCLSPRQIICELRKFESTVVKNESTYWIFFELLVRDYFHLVALRAGAALFRPLGPRGHRGRGGGGDGAPGPAPLPPPPPSPPPGGEGGGAAAAAAGEEKAAAWCRDPSDPRFLAWKEGRTGYPFIDANMRELRATGFMSNRGRQNVASFLCNDLGLDWRLGAEFFEERLIDYDPASNWVNWAYVAGVGPDPRSGARYFNIIKQGLVYDPEARYVLHWIPELACIQPPTRLLELPPPGGWGVVLAAAAATRRQLMINPSVNEIKRIADDGKKKKMEEQEQEEKKEEEAGGCFFFYPWPIVPLQHSLVKKRQPGHDDGNKAKSHAGKNNGHNNSSSSNAHNDDERIKKKLPKASRTRRKKQDHASHDDDTGGVRESSNNNNNNNTV